MSGTISSTFYHSTPRMTRRRNTVGFGPLKGEKFCCDANAWLDLEQMATELDKLDDTDSAATANSADDWWLVELSQAPTKDAEKLCNNGCVSVTIRLRELLSRWVSGDIVRGKRITTTDAKLLVLEKADTSRERVATVRGKVATEKSFAAFRKKELEECDPEDDLCTCQKCREEKE